MLFVLKLTMNVELTLSHLRQVINKVNYSRRQNTFYMTFFALISASVMNSNNGKKVTMQKRPIDQKIYHPFFIHLCTIHTPKKGFKSA